MKDENKKPSRLVQVMATLLLTLICWIAFALAVALGVWLWRLVF